MRKYDEKKICANPTRINLKKTCAYTTKKELTNGFEKPRREQIISRSEFNEKHFKNY